MTLGILVSSEDNMDLLLGLVRAAAQKGHRILIFLTGRGTILTTDPGFSELSSLAEIGLCLKSLEELGLDPQAAPAGVELSNQSWHGRLLDRSNRYLVL